MPERIRFGYYIFQDGLTFKKIRRIALECENLGLDSIWVKDNFEPWLGNWFPDFPTKRDQAFLDGWTTISTLSALTTRIRLCMVLVNLYRQPAMVAKMASTLDAISDGRVELGLSAGWNQEESEAYGVTFPSPIERVKRVDEAIQVIKRMWTGTRASFKGDYYAIQNALCEPKPLQKPHPPLWVGGRGRRTLRIAVGHADGWIHGLVPISSYVASLRKLRELCDGSRRAWEDLTKAWYGLITLDESTGERTEPNKKKHYFSESVLRGTPDEITKELQQLVDLGVRYFVPHFTGGNELDQLRIFARRVKPKLN